jgi:uracil-DNA glycosylase
MKMQHDHPLSLLAEEITKCFQCSRLRSWCESAKGRNPQFADYDYWSKPVPGFGDPDGRLLIIGFAPGQHGANRTGRVFTGDRAGDWLY